MHKGEIIDVSGETRHRVPRLWSFLKLLESIAIATSSLPKELSERDRAKFAKRRRSDIEDYKLERQVADGKR